PVVGESEDKMNNILSAILVGRMNCWVSFRKLEKGIEITGLIVTTIVIDTCSNTHSLLLYVIYSPEGVELGDDGWVEGLEALSKYAKSVGCNRLTGYTDVEYVIEMAERFGGEAKYKFVSVPIK
ncbi:unnamed protein product, partial [marine sediment metagenome]